MPDNNGKHHYDFDKLSESWFKEVFKPVRTIFIELECLRDIDIGAILSMIKTDTEYKYILSKIPVYQNSFSITPIEYMPALKFTQADVDKFKADPANQQTIDSRAPSTTMQTGLGQLMELINAHNKKYYAEITPVNFIINSPTYNCGKLCEHQIVSMLRSIEPYGDITFTSDDVRDNDDSFFRCIDLFIINDLKLLMDENHDFVKKLISRGILLDKFIAATAVVDYELVTDRNRSLEALQNSLRMLNVFCNFTYVMKDVITNKE